MPAGNIAIRFSTENAEVVRQALQALGKDGAKALSQLNNASQPTNRGLNALSSVIGELKGTAVGLAFSLGPIGTGLVALGPAGLAAAAAIGGVVTMFKSWTGVTDEFVQKSREIKEAADTAGLSILAFKALRGIGGQLGKDAQQISTGIDKLTVSIEEARRGTGPLYEQLMRIDAAMARDIATTLGTADAIDALGLAYTRLTQAQKNELDKAVFGRSGIGMGELIEKVRDKGGMAAIQQAAAAANPAMEDLVKNAAKVSLEIDNLNGKTAEMWGSAGSKNWLQYRKEVAEDWNKITIAIFSATGALSKWWTAQPKPQGPGRTPSQWENREQNRRAVIGPWETNTTAGSAWDTTTRAVPKAAQRLEEMQRWTSVLGDAIKPSEQLALKQLELAAAIEKGGVSQEAANRSLAAFTLGQEKAALATRTQLGLATEQQSIAVKTKELDDLQAKGFIKNAEERAAAQRLAEKEARDVYDAQRVRLSDTPALTKLSIDADKLRTNLDDGLASALRGTTSDILEMAKGTKSASEAFTGMAQRIADAVAQAMLLKVVVQPIANSLGKGLGGLFGGSQDLPSSWTTDVFTAPSALGNIFSRGSVSPFALGGVLTRPTTFPMANGGVGLAREAGYDEAVMPLRRMSNGRLGVSAMGGGSMQLNVQVINNHPTAQVSTRQEDDGRGGRRLVTQIDEAVANAVAQPGSRAGRSIRQLGGLARR